MRIYTKGIAVLLMLLLVSCQKTELLEDQYFIKSFGANANSSMSFVLEKEDGGYVLAGRIGVPAYVGNAFNNVGAQKFIEASGPAMIITDSRANTIRQRIFPIEDLELADSVYVDELSGTGRLLQLFPRPDGGYFGLGLFRNFGIGVGSDYNEPTSGNILSYLIYFNSDLQLEKFQLLSADPSSAWDGYYRAKGVVRERPTGGYMLLLGVNFDYTAFKFRGFQLMELDDYGMIQSSKEYYGGQFRIANDFAFLPNGDIAVLGQASTSDVNLFLVDGQTMNYKFNRFIIDDGVFGTWNQNPMFVLPDEDGSVDIVMADPNKRSLIVRTDENFNTTDTINIEPEFEEQFPRSACRAPNGDLLILNDDLTGGASERSFLYRFDKDGQRKFRIGFDGPGRYVTNASDGSILVLVDLPFNGVSVKKSTLYKISPDGTF